ncbi:MAG: prepilin peptidase [Alphaproteobacteria bacterium]|nr:prepilin peptidase [Alphaproteobacteria bacterium]
MGGHISVPVAILLVGLLVGGVHDAFTKRIPNWLTFSLMVVGLAVTATLGPALPEGEVPDAGFGFALAGLLAAFVLHFVLWQAGLEGAGDAKLMMGAGAFIGWETMIEATFWRYVLLVPYAVVTLTVMRRWGAFRDAVMWTVMRARGIDAGERPEPVYMPFGPLIAVATPLAMFTATLDFF